MRWYVAVCTNHRRIGDVKYIKENKLVYRYDQIRRDTEVQQQKVVISLGVLVPFRVRFDNNNTIRTLELSLQAAGTDG